MKLRGRLSSKATVQGDIYRSGGGGGSTVEITPIYNTGTKIADYEIDGEGGSIYIPSGYSETTLWEGSGYTDSIWNLSESYKNFDAIEIYVRGGTGDNYITSHIISKTVLEVVQSSPSFRYGITTDGWYSWFYVRSDTQFERADTGSLYVNKIIGIKYGG